MRLRNGARWSRTTHFEAVKKSTASRKGAKAQREASSKSFNFFAGLCGFAPLREIFWLGAHFFTPSLCHVCDPPQSLTSQKAAMYAPTASNEGCLLGGMTA